MSNVDILTAAEKAFADLGADKKAADSVTALINKIGTVGRESGKPLRQPARRTML